MSGECAVAPWRENGTRWDAFVRGDPQATVFHLHGWGGIIERTYGHRAIPLAATYSDDELVGVLPLVLIESRLFGRNLVSMPFVDYGGPLAGGDHSVLRSLVAAAEDLATDLGAGLCLRCAEELPVDQEVWLEKVTMLIDVGCDEEELWRRLPSERRNRVRKAQKLGLQTRMHGAEAIDAFYEVFATNMRDLGSPVHSRRLFREILQTFPENVRIALVRDGGRVIGGACFLHYGDTVTIPGWISSLRSTFSRCPNALLHWDLMRFAISGRYSTLDLGRSSRDSGTFEAKRQWHAAAKQLYWYFAPHAPPAGGEQARFAWLPYVWRRLPLAAANWIGPQVRKGLAN